MLKKSLLFFLFSFSLAFLGSSALAVCPVCTFAVVAGVGLSRWLGVDDLVSGVWAGGLIASVIMWTLSWMDSKNYKFRFRNFTISAAFYLLTIVPLYYSGIMGHPYNELWGIDKLLLGIIFGSIAFISSVYLHEYLKKKNEGKSYFPYQKVVIPVSALAILSLVIFVLIKI